MLTESQLLRNTFEHYLGLTYPIPLTVNDWLINTDLSEILYDSLSRYGLNRHHRASSTDINGRRLLVIRTSLGNAVVFERYPPRDASKPYTLQLLCVDEVSEFFSVQNKNELTRREMSELGNLTYNKVAAYNKVLATMHPTPAPAKKPTRKTS